MIVLSIPKIRARRVNSTDVVTGYYAYKPLMKKHYILREEVVPYCLYTVFDEVEIVPETVEIISENEIKPSDAEMINVKVNDSEDMCSDENPVKSDFVFPNFKAFDLIIINSPHRHLIGRLYEDSNYQLFHFEWCFDLSEKRLIKNMHVILSVQDECIPGIVKLAEREDEELAIFNKEQFNPKIYL